MTTRTIAWIIVVAACCTPGAHAQLKIHGNKPVLSVATGFPGQEPLPVINTSCGLRWRREDVITKITVLSRCPGQKFTLKVLATNLSDGVAAPEVTLSDGMLATDLITDIPERGRPSKDCTLRYTASATFAQGNSVDLGSDTHTITYTVVAQ